MIKGGLLIVSHPAWTYVMEDGALPEGVMTVVFPFGVPVMLVRRGQDIYAVSNKCAHMGCPLSRGSLGGFIVECPCHEWTFDVRTGQFITAPEIRVPTYECKAENSKIYVKI
jgi:3-phenylpropionate/trans-cinnamate dioxygenase ferredoxin subunit